MCFILFAHVHICIQRKEWRRGTFHAENRILGAPNWLLLYNVYTLTIATNIFWGLIICRPLLYIGHLSPTYEISRNLVNGEMHCPLSLYPSTLPHLPLRRVQPPIPATVVSSDLQKALVVANQCKERCLPILMETKEQCERFERHTGLTEEKPYPHEPGWQHC